MNNTAVTNPAGNANSAIAGTANMNPMTASAPAMASAGAPLGSQPGGAQTNGTGVSGSAQAPAANNGLLYDLSSLDPLQAHALQLTASAGLTNLLSAAPADSMSQGGRSQHQALHHIQPAPNGSQMQQEVGLQAAAAAGNYNGTPMPPLAAAPNPTAQSPSPGSVQNPYYYLQQPPGAPVGAPAPSLQPVASQPPSTGANGMPAPAPGYALPSSTHGSAPPLAPLPPGYPVYLLNGLSVAGGPGAPGAAALPNFLVANPYVTNGAAQPSPAPIAPATNGKRERPTIDQQLPTKKRDLGALSVVSSSPANGFDPSAVQFKAQTSQGGAIAGNGPDLPPTEHSQDVLDKMTPAERRRYERNLREQQRSYRISQQIKELRDVLAESSVPFKPNKYSILLSVVEYIKQLQSRAIMLDSEHQKLITTIRKTNEMVHSGQSPSSADDTEATHATAGSSDCDNEMLFVQGLDYRSVFEQCPAALGIAALDGRILESNPEFRTLLGFSHDELLRQSLFNLVRNHQEIFRAMAEMLKTAEESSVEGADSAASSNNRFWSGAVVSKRNIKLSMNLTLTLGEDGSPKFFNCALTTVSE